MSFDSNINFISLMAGHSAGELMPKMYLSYCLMHAENQWDLSLRNSLWKQSFSHLAATLPERRESGLLRSLTRTQSSCSCVLLTKLLALSPQM